MTRQTIYQREFSPEDVSSPVGRVKTFLKEPHRKTMPHSCVFRKYHNNLSELLTVIAKDLCGGAGVKINLDEFEEFEPYDVNWGFCLNPNHTDIQYLSEGHKPYYFSGVSGEELTHIIDVADSMSGRSGILKSLQTFINCLMQGDFIVVNLSALRPAGYVNDKGLMASGPIGRNLPNEASFFSIYKAIAYHLADGKIGSLLTLLGTVNDCLRRGGYKRGIVCTSLDYRSNSIEDYLDFDNNSCPGGHKKSVRLNQGVLDSPCLDKIVSSAEEESTFLEKINYKRLDLYANVCVGIGIPENHICLIWRYNLGQIRHPDDIPFYIESATRDAIELHQTWRSHFSEEELSHLPSLEEDRQIAIDPIGMASFLAQLGITYSEFTRALAKYNANPDGFVAYNIAELVVLKFAEGFTKSISVADELQLNVGLEPLERIITPCEPSQRHFVDLLDAEDYTVTRSVFPPFERKQRRVSDHENQSVYEHNPNIEIASEVGAKLIFDFSNQWAKFVNSFGRSHGYMSFDSLEPITTDWIKKFLDSDLMSKYYSESSRYDQSYLKKQSAVCSLGDASDLEFEEGRADECVVCAE